VGSPSFLASTHYHKSTRVYYDKVGGSCCSPYQIFRRFPRTCVGGICCCSFFICLIVIMGVGPGTKTTELYITALETVLINPDTTWYSHIEVETTDLTQVVSYKLSEVPPLSPQSVEKNEHHLINLSPGQFQYWSYKLTAGAAVVLSFTQTKTIEFVVIRGEFYFNSWKSGSITKTEKNLYTNQLTQWSYTVSADDVYYFIWKNANQDSTNGEVLISISMKTYDLSKYTEICVDNTDCLFELQRGSSECVIVAGLDSNTPDDRYHIRYFVQPRRDYYWTIFGILTGIMGCVIFVTFGVVFTLYYRQRAKNTVDSTTQPFIIKGSSKSTESAYQQN